MTHMGMRSEQTVQTDEDRAQSCAECGFMKEYDYSKKIYYCDNENRTDDMGKLSVNELPKTSPEWCPLKRRGR